MTETDLLDDLSRLLREGLVAIDADQMDGFDEDAHAAPRFYVTPRGREQLRQPIDAPEGGQ